MSVKLQSIERECRDFGCFDTHILKILLQDKTTKGNILWGTNEYLKYGDGYSAKDEIKLMDINGIAPIVRPRITKSRESQTNRIRNIAEVFTPSWVCNKQNNLIDRDWFGKEDVFNIETECDWEPVNDKIEFPKVHGKTWQDYVLLKRLEMSCGEAPYLTSRYDATSGKNIAIEKRIGLLDRKLRIISENTDSESEWCFFSKKAVQSIYGYDLQGDNVFLARKNLLTTIIEFYKAKFNNQLSIVFVKEIAKVLAWNIFQMDGIKFVIPNSCGTKVLTQSLFGTETKEINCIGCAKNSCGEHNGIYCRTYDWVANRSIEFYSTFIKRKKI